MTVGNGQQQSFLSLDSQKSACLWWGQSLLWVTSLLNPHLWLKVSRSMNWVFLSTKMQALRDANMGKINKIIRKGSISWYAPFSLNPLCWGGCRLKAVSRSWFFQPCFFWRQLSFHRWSATFWTRTNYCKPRDHKPPRLRSSLQRACHLGRSRCLRQIPLLHCSRRSRSVVGP